MSTLEDRAHENLCVFTLWTGRLEPDARTIDRGGVVGTKTALDWPSTRTVVRRSNEGSAAGWVETANAFLFDDGKTGCAFTRIGVDDDVNAILLEQGWAEFATTPEMVCEAPLEPRLDPPGFRIRLAVTSADVSAYARVSGEAFAHLGLPAESVRSGIDNPERFLAPEVAVSVAEREDGTIVAGATSIRFGDDAYVAWVACADDARGHGLGDLVTRLVTNEAFARGAELVTLEASHFGENTYARMGYREIYRYRILIKV